jgi:type II secretory pathway pseudopilin PulG
MIWLDALVAASPRRGKTCAAPARHAGFTYLGALFLVSLLGVTAAMASVVWSTEQRRENERQLVFAGLQFQSAIESYRKLSKEGEAPYPRRLEDLLRDGRAMQVSHHLRQVYVDPIMGDRAWGLVRLPDGGIVGVYSRSGRAPLQRAALGHGLTFPDAKTYRDWRFIALSATDLVPPSQ